MKKIVLSMDDDVFGEWQAGIFAKGICGGLYGVVDGINVKITEAMKKGEEELHLSFKKGRKNGATKKSRD